MQIIPIKTRRIRATDSLVEVLGEGLRKAKVKLMDGDILAVVSKVVALTEGGLVDLVDREGSSGSSSRFKKNLHSLIQKEADIVLNTKSDDFLLTIKNGILTPNAGVDQSNIPEGSALGWPQDSYTSARNMHLALKKMPSKKSPLKKVGVLIFDSCIMPLRNGVVGVALGYSGFHGVEDYRGKKDLFGKTLRVTQKNIVDNLASAATLMTGEGAESVPFVIIRGAPVKFLTGKKSATITQKTRSEIVRDPAECLYKELYPARLRSVATTGTI